MLLIICVSIMIVVHFILPSIKILRFPFNLLGIATFCIGIWMSKLGSDFFEKKKTTVMTFDTPSVLVKEGLYKYSRNPMYLGFAFIVIGIWMLMGSLFTLFPVTLFLIVMDRYYIRFEENMLHRTFGDEYLEYKKQVRRWI